ncbi:CHC2 zinc finger domain-containing protein [Billgrantia ethanolica]|uniref:Zinc finger CHC2-type domain-containing protein n=1 Tax=Billgrantia ethanolica TaxID=2733486 RepID=A0ABS9A1N0_9GAMM|nr:CHC2 zinc finger domain-containing protein [Halomonas ethanolica]MCE8002719.1 hypothetical protein [Halomonas ethanolica]
MKTPDLGGGQAQRNTGITHHTADVNGLLARLDKVKRTGQGRWVACCPAHQDKHPSLSVRETDDGTVLVKCWAGCGAADVVAAVGLSLADLFPNRPDDHHRKPLSKGQRWIPRDVLGCVAREALIALLAAEQVSKGVALHEDDIQRLAVAAGRLRAAAEGVGYEFKLSR